MMWKELKNLLKGVVSQRSAEIILAALEIKDRPVDIFAIANLLEVKVRTADTKDEVLLHFSEGNPTIFVRHDAPSVRQRFSVAHALGHLFLHSEDNNSNIYFSDASFNSNSIMEMQANRFAANILIPENELIELIENKTPKNQIANYFGVSEGVLSWQISDIL